MRRCGARVAGQLSWPSNLPDGRIYLAEMRSVQGDPPRYRVISPGSRYEELPDDQSLRTFHAAPPSVKGGGILVSMVSVNVTRTSRDGIRSRRIDP